MDYSKKLRVLVVGFLLVINEVGGELNKDSASICDFCSTDDLNYCNSTALNQISSTMNCELCTLGLEQSFDDFDNLSTKSIDPAQICFFQQNLKSGATSIPYEEISSLLPGVYEALEITSDLITTESTITHAFSDYQDDEAKESIRKFRSDPIPEDEDQLPPLPTEMITCFLCNSSSDAACINNADKLDTIECPKPNDCMTFYNDGHLTRNCSFAIPPESIKLCQRRENSSCQMCSESMCNKMPWKQCYQCNSKDNRECSLWSNVTSISVSICPEYDDKCLIRITPDGDTIRECSPAHFKCPIGESCSICDASLCNGDIYPTTRRRCMQCQNCENLQDSTAAQPCVRFSPDEKCFMYVTANSKMIRGCLSDTEEMQQCEMSQTKCITCEGKDGCNDSPLMKNTTLSCIKCNSKDDPSCAWAQLPAAAVKCQNKVLYYLVETCLIDYDPLTQYTVRDCSFDYGACSPEDHNCRSCTGDGCNISNLKVQKCIQCSSQNADQIKCRHRAEGIHSSECPQEIQFYETKGCYTMTLGNITTRGCIAGLNQSDLKYCIDEGKAHCDVCDEDDCNNKLAPSKGWKKHAMSLLVVLLGLVFVVL